jgi:hypothetical protein
MSAKASPVLAAVVLTALALTGCGGHSLPKTPANVAVCRVLAKVLGGKAPMIDLTGATLMSNAPISHQLRQDIATYIAMEAQNMSGAEQAAAKASADCQSLGS